MEKKAEEQEKKAVSEENLRRRRLKNKKEKPFMRRIQGREGVELQRKLHLKRILGEEG